MKNIISILFFVFFFSACQTTSKESFSPDRVGGEESVGEVVGSGGEDTSAEDDLESEFSDSEDFEKEVAEESFPTDSEEEGLGFADAEVETKTDSSEESDSGKTAETSSDPEESVEITESEVAAEEESSEPQKIEIDVSEEEASSEEESAQSDLASSVVINNIRYEAGENKIYIDGTGNFSYQSRRNEANNQVVIEIPNAVLSESLQWPFVMKDFDTQIALLQADQKDETTVRIVLQMRDSASSPSVLVADSGLVISPVAKKEGEELAESVEGELGSEEPSPVESSATGEEGEAQQILPAQSLNDFLTGTPKFVGRPISIHLKDVDIRDVLYFISEGTGLNMVINDDVRGTISIKLRNVPWDQALLLVMKTKQLGYLREGNVIRILTIDSLKRDQRDIQDLVKSQEILEPLKVKVIPVVYTKVADLRTTVESFLTLNRGRTVVDTPTNSLIVTDTSSVIEKIEKLIKSIDKSPTQVMIEAKIVEARENFARDLGASWSFRGTPFSPPLNQQLALNITGGLDAFPAAQGGGTRAGGRTLNAPFNIFFAPIGNLNASLGISETEGLVRVISSPRIMVLNGETAKITQSTETISISTQQSSDTGQALGTSAQRTPVVLSFEVKPQITAVGSVFMEIKMRREFPGPIADPASRARPVNSREAETKVLVHNGQTIVIGGIYQSDETQSEEGLPILRHIPILNWLFSRVEKSRIKNELLLFLTPRVLDFQAAESTEIH